MVKGLVGRIRRGRIKRAERLKAGLCPQCGNEPKGEETEAGENCLKYRRERTKKKDIGMIIKKDE